MAVGKGELMQECFEIRRRKTEEGKKFERRDTERSKAGIKEKEVPTQSRPNENKTLINTI